MLRNSQFPPPPQSGATSPVPEVTLEATARSFYRLAIGYGFALRDFVRFVDILLGIAMVRKEESAPPSMRAPPPVWTEHHTLPLVGQQVTIRRFGEPGDHALLAGWVSDADGRFFLLSTASGRVNDVDDLMRDPKNVLGMIVYQGRPVGCLAYLDYDVEQHRAELRKMIGEADMRGLGLAREASELWVGYGLGALGLKKIYVNTLSTHIANIKINEEIGFSVEGILRNEVLIDGEYRDVLRMGLWRG